MKLIFCRTCQDVRKLRYIKTSCMCGSSWGWYEQDGLHAVVGGRAIPIGFSNLSFSEALANQTKRGRGLEFVAFVIPEKCDTIERM